MIDIIGRSKLWFLISAIFIIVGIFALASNGIAKGSPMNFGIDFTGGSTLFLRFERSADLEEVREVLAKYDRANAVIQRSGEKDLIIKTEPLKNEDREGIINDIKEKYAGTVLLEADTIGPVIGKELRRQAFWALLVAIAGILTYVAFRFEFKYGVAAIIALVHDAVITIGLIALLWRSVDTPFVAAILTVIGYSINDTIVIFDRIRENLNKTGAVKQKFEDIVNVSVNQTFARSINTVVTVLFMNVALFIFGGATIKDFALTLLIGFSAGAYSSIFVASPVLVMLTKWGKKRS